MAWGRIWIYNGKPDRFVARHAGGAVTYAGASGAMSSDLTTQDVCVPVTAVVTVEMPPSALVGFTLP